jgi:hypothetical protein
MSQESIDRLTLCLISNGDVSAVTSQEVYEYVWDQGIRPLREDLLKPERQTRRKRREPRHQVAGNARDRARLRFPPMLKMEETDLTTMSRQWSSTTYLQPQNDVSILLSEESNLCLIMGEE